MDSAKRHIVMENRANGATIENRTISRYGVVFDSDSLPLTIENESGERFTVVERITAESIRNADMEDMICARNHDFDKVLGRRSNDTMRIDIDNAGIKYTTDVCRTTYGDDTLENVKRNDISGSSFVFSYDPKDGYEITEREDGAIVAIPKTITKIYEMGPVTSPAYLGTIQNRSDDLVQAVNKYVQERNRKAESEPKPAETEERMDVMDMVDIVSSAFYREFDYTDDSWYYIQSIQLDNSLVAKEKPSSRLYLVQFEISESNEVSFSGKEEWVEVQKEFIPVNQSRAFYDALNEAKEKRHNQENEAGDTEQRSEEQEVNYPFPKGYWSRKAKAKRRV